MKQRPTESFPIGRALAFVAIALAAGVVSAVLLKKNSGPQEPQPELRPRLPAPTVSVDPPYAPRPAGGVTFNRDIAPILYKECAPCHRPGEAAPFELLTFEDARKRARQIQQVTTDRYMPPFLPEPGPVPFANTRRLTAVQLGLIRQWVEDGAIEGAASDLPPRPVWTSGWRLGPPDFIVQMPQPYLLQADGLDVYRNFVIPMLLRESRFVRAVEFRAGTRAIHHVFVQTDRTKNSRRRDEQDPAVGYDGMDSPVTAESPSGHFMSWQPGRGPTEMPPGLPWTVEPGTDLIFQMHLQTTGKPEPVQSSIGLYFTTHGPTNTPYKLSLSSFNIDIPPGQTNYLLEDQFTLPVDVDLLAVLPHAHYLASRMEGRAFLPDGTVQSLLTIPRWDFNWQSDFRYSWPISLPRGTRIAMRYTYDNSTNNIRNPHQPPQRVRYGLNSTDEMGEFWIQVLTRNPADLERLQQAFALRAAENAVTYNRFLLERDPANARAYNNLGKALVILGRPEEGIQQFRTAARLKPDFDEARYHLGVMASIAGNKTEAENEYLAAIAANPEHFKARNNLGELYLEQQRYEEAQKLLLEVLRLNPGDPNATANLRIIDARQKGTTP